MMGRPTRHLLSVGRDRGVVWLIALLASLALVASARWHAVADDTDGVGLAEEEVFRAAAAAVAPAVVRVEVAGVSEAGLGGPAEASPASGPSSGLVVGAEGWVVATSFAVPKDATQAVVTLPGGTRHVARVTGRDLARGLVLLKIDLPAGMPPLPVTEAVPREALSVGQGTLVLGRAWSASEPSVGVGILSATNRAWGRAVQTDASVSPANYGGPLVDLEGRVIGVLAPLPAETAGMMVGTELYDSGIGFAVPLEDILRVLPRLQAGETLSPGIIGIGYTSRDPFTAPPIVATCRADSPAGRSGLRAGDRIVEAGGHAVSRVAELRHAIAPLYAGDAIDLVVERGEARERIAVRVELVATLPPWRRPVLGLVPRRAGPGAAGDPGGAKPADGDAAKPGVSVAWTWPDGPAARAGIEPGDRITSVRQQADGGAAEPAPLEVTTPAILGGFLAGLDAGTGPDTVALDGPSVLIGFGAHPLRLPLAPSAPPAPLPPPDAPVHIVEPDDDLREMFLAALRPLGRPLRAAAGPAEAEAVLGSDIAAIGVFGHPGAASLLGARCAHVIELRDAPAAPTWSRAAVLVRPFPLSALLAACRAAGPGGTG